MTRNLVVAVFTALLGTAVVVAGILVLCGPPVFWWRGLLAAGVISTLAAIASLGPMLFGLRRGINAAVAGYFIATGVRLVISVGGCVLAVVRGGYPRVATLLLMVAFYLAVLAVESITMARWLWTMQERKKRRENTMLSLAAIPMLLAEESPLEHVVDHRLSFLPLTYHMVMLITTGIIMLVLFPMITRKYRSGEMVPTGTQLS